MPSVVEASTLPVPERGCFLHCASAAARAPSTSARSVAWSTTSRAAAYGQKHAGKRRGSRTRAPRAVRDGAIARSAPTQPGGRYRTRLSGNKGYCNAFNWAEELCASEFPTNMESSSGGPEHVNAHDVTSDGWR